MAPLAIATALINDLLQELEQLLEGLNLGRASCSNYRTSGKLGHRRQLWVCIMGGLLKAMCLAIIFTSCASGGDRLKFDKPSYRGDRNLAGQPHGRGVMSWRNGEKYEGEFRNGLRHGQGTYYKRVAKIGTGVYAGAWVEGTPMGTVRSQRRIRICWVLEVWTEAWKWLAYLSFRFWIQELRRRMA